MSIDVKTQKSNKGYKQVNFLFGENGPAFLYIMPLYPCLISIKLSIIYNVDFY